MSDVTTEDEILRGRYTYFRSETGSIGRKFTGNLVSTKENILPRLQLVFPCLILEVLCMDLLLRDLVETMHGTSVCRRIRGRWCA